MMRTALYLFSLFSVASATPAIIWKSGEQSAPAFHTSDRVESTELFEDVLREPSHDSALASVVFLFGRGQNGTESLTQLTSAGALPGVAGKSEEAHCMHHHVAGMESSAAVESQASRVNLAHKVVQVSLDEFSRKMTSIDEPADAEVPVTGSTVMSKSAKSAGKRARALAAANVLIVNVDADEDAHLIDSAVVSAIEHKSVGSVVVTAVRSTKEVIAEREMRNRSRRLIQEEAGRRLIAQQSRFNHRRLEDQQNEADDQVNNGNQGQEQDLTGIYFVSMTPNIMSGLLFALLFAVITHIALTCMGMISGQDVYVNKYPSIGREA